MARGGKTLQEGGENWPLIPIWAGLCTPNTLTEPSGILCLGGIAMVEPSQSSSAKGGDGIMLVLNNVGEGSRPAFYSNVSFPFGKRM